MQSFITLSFLAAATVVRAQYSSSSSATPTSSAVTLIPTGISSGCSSFLQSLDSNSTLTSYVAPIVNATSAFSPYANSTNASSNAVNTVLGSLCASSSTSDDSAIRTQLSSFYSSCTNELTGSSSNKDVIRIYDVLYAIVPMKKAVCSKDDSGNYCVNQISSSVSSASAPGGGTSKSVTSTGQSTYELVQNNLWSYSGSLSKRADSDGAALIPNTTTYRSSNLPFLFLTPSLSSDKLCVSCTRSVLSAYMNFEQSVPYALGIANSPMLGGQPELYSAVNSTCGSNFMNGAVQAAGGLSGGIVGSGAPHLTPEGGMITAAAAAILGLVAVL
ncbi:uncharacterized protein FOMMEDRAFT_27426 [Fomitiporia mediterranea MF3/22]|uniref:uncharacterized protein n=1 Tax=Fomitiporia mediterranea (strain MF3/22) TaxID=694068 RepID=UPI000440847A|nr:uncharacterized protein FOMMEDRAFT_27426 [Fomitiporia mediterranea MF3/22]EJD05261.1 hypothetical protein FOMMEDRAFT_27426 [Fomitiporia mediterranea MF3/22]